MVTQILRFLSFFPISIETVCSLLFQTPVKFPFVITFGHQQTVMQPQQVSRSIDVQAKLLHDKMFRYFPKYLQNNNAIIFVPLQRAGCDQNMSVILSDTQKFPHLFGKKI